MVHRPSRGKNLARDLGVMTQVCKAGVDTLLHTNLVASRSTMRSVTCRTSL